MTWRAAYPTITVILASFKPLGLMALPLPVRTLALTAIMVPTVAFVLVPGTREVASQMGGRLLSLSGTS